MEYDKSFCSPPVFDSLSKLKELFLFQVKSCSVSVIDVHQLLYICFTAMFPSFCACWDLLALTSDRRNTNPEFVMQLF